MIFEERKSKKIFKKKKIQKKNWEKQNLGKFFLKKTEIFFGKKILKEIFGKKFKF